MNTTSDIKISLHYGTPLWQNPEKITVAQKIENNKLCLHFLRRNQCRGRISVYCCSSNVQKLEKIGVPYIRILDITGGIYFSFFAIWNENMLRKRFGSLHLPKKLGTI